LIKAVAEMPNEEFIVATDDGIFWKMHQLAPGKKLISAPTAGAGATCESCAHCPWMAMNALQNLEQVLISGHNAIEVAQPVRRDAVASIQRMLDFAATQGISGALPKR
jgi:quinolinate synthase